MCAEKTNEKTTESCCCDGMAEMMKNCCPDGMAEKMKNCCPDGMAEKMKSFCPDGINGPDCFTKMKEMKDKFCGEKTADPT